MKLNDLVKKITAAKTVVGMPVKIVAIDGHGGAGKSTLAKQLAEVLNAEIIHTDDFASWRNPIEWWPVLIETVLEPIKDGAKVLSYERSSWGPEHRPKPIQNQPVTQIVILEGVSSMRKEFRQYLSFGIWVDALKEVCIARGLERDGEGARSQWEKWWAEEERYIKRDNPRYFADITYNT